MAPFFGPKIGEDQKNKQKKQGFRCKMSGFSVLKCVKTKKKGRRLKINGFLVQIRIGSKQSKKKRHSPQIGGVIVSHHNMLSPQNGDTRDAPLATPLELT